MPVTVELRGLVQRFGHTEVLHGLDLDINTGVLGLLGPNGAGKTTVLRTLATIVRPSSGSIRLLNFDITRSRERRELRRRLGYLPQSLGYYPSFTVFEYVEYLARLKEVNKREIRSAVVKAIERVGLGDRTNAKLKTLSGGMIRRVGIAQAIVNEPDLLLLDEPTVGLDPEQRISFRTLIRELGEHSTIIVSTHLVEDVGAACTEVAVLESGSLCYHGTLHDLTLAGQMERGLGDSPLERGYSATLAKARV